MRNPPLTRGRFPFESEFAPNLFTENTKKGLSRLAIFSNTFCFQYRNERVFAEQLFLVTK